MGWGRAVEEGNSSMIDLIHCKNFCKCYNVPPPNTTIKRNRTVSTDDKTGQNASAVESLFSKALPHSQGWSLHDLITS
jgi:hypothetical protein